ncbi:claspin-like [Drosophila kikkawai]|uniref:Claspin-like n=1 Tax=Drosophila kikkawai TaxID=30033 RepID=A0ABM4GHB1_DROKI
MDKLKLDEEGGKKNLHRDDHINVFYHQAKPKILKEFLARRTINAPLATHLAGGSPMPNKQPRESVGLRLASEDLEDFVKLMEATEFFKTQSETEEEEESAPELAIQPMEEDALAEEEPRASTSLEANKTTSTKERLVTEVLVLPKLEWSLLNGDVEILTKMQEYFKTLTTKRIEKLRKMQKEEEQEGLANEDDIDVDDNKENEPENKHGDFQNDSPIRN